MSTYSLWYYVSAFSTSHQIPSVKEKQEKTKAAAEENTKFTTSHKVTRPTQAPVKQRGKVKFTETATTKRETRQTTKHGKIVLQ